MLSLFTAALFCFALWLCPFVTKQQEQLQSHSNWLITLALIGFA